MDDDTFPLSTIVEKWAIAAAVGTDEHPTPRDMGVSGPPLQHAPSATSSSSTRGSPQAPRSALMLRPPPKRVIPCGRHR